MAKKPKLDSLAVNPGPEGTPIPSLSGTICLRQNGTSYVVYDDVPIERFENFCMPPMPAKDIVMMLAGVSPLDYSRMEMSPWIASDIRRLLVDSMMPENPNADRTEIEKFVDERIAEVRAAISA